MAAGPTEIEERIRNLGSKHLVYNRTKGFSKFISEIHENLKYVFQTKNDVFILTCSGTGAMEAAVVNTLSKGDEVLVANNGNFGERWKYICEAYGIKVNEIRGKFGYGIDSERVKAALTGQTKAVLITANETSCGALTDVKAVGAVIKDTKAILIVDAISCICCDEFKTDEWKCDVVLTSAHKGISIPPGLAFITFSDKAWKYVETSTLPKYYFDAKEYKNNVQRGQTPFTPGISLLFQLSERLKKIRGAGLDKYIEKNSKLAKILRIRLKELNLELVGPKLSNFVTGVYAPKNIDASKIVEIMEYKHNIFLAPSPGDLKTKLFRIGTAGDISEEDVNRTISCLKQTLIELSKE